MGWAFGHSGGWLAGSLKELLSAFIASGVMKDLWENQKGMMETVIGLVIDIFVISKLDGTTHCKEPTY